MTRRSLVPLLAIICIWITVAASFTVAETGQQPDEQTADTLIENGMDNERLQAVIEKVDSEYVGQSGYWKFRIANLAVTVITDEAADRMRIVIPIRTAAEVEAEELFRILQANFDSALDARYAIARGVLWSTYIHPLSALTEKEFLSGLGQAVNIVTTYGESYSSGALSFGGGDSKDLLQRKLLEEGAAI